MTRSAVRSTSCKSACRETAARFFGGDLRWEETCKEFLVSVPGEMQSSVERALRNSHEGGVGLRAWVSSIAWRGSKLPESVPAELLKVYFADPEAVPLHECETCGISIPVRPNRFRGMEDEPEETYFSTCPVCCGRTGLYLYMSRQLEGDTDGAVAQPFKPR